MKNKMMEVYGVKPVVGSCKSYSNPKSECEGEGYRYPEGCNDCVFWGGNIIAYPQLTAGKVLLLEELIFSKSFSNVKIFISRTTNLEDKLFSYTLYLYPDITIYASNSGDKVNKDGRTFTLASLLIKLHSHLTAEEVAQVKSILEK